MDVCCFFFHIINIFSVKFTFSFLIGLQRLKIRLRWKLMALLEYLLYVEICFTDIYSLSFENFTAFEF